MFILILDSVEDFHTVEERRLHRIFCGLKIDPWEVFYPELQQRDAAFRQLQLLLKECSDEEIASLLPICQATLSVLKSKGAIQIE